MSRNSLGAWENICRRALRVLTWDVEEPSIPSMQHMHAERSRAILLQYRAMDEEDS